ncbi:aminoglycoside phosphotransferase family protein [Allopontixanthobacter sp.]|uniref:aminoglycoside phosphotransferase family protein n=1 Tax=Allopontixanthobacter sp. TaxID=2906452 RepID=UPI002ABC943B|nr:phosphotransferase [Allopontixanthobacter sp.]MDZ4308797.1 phosphotransferase [Allopontixanthobacter sp.]
MSELLPAGIDSFLGNAGWGGAAIDPIPGDASFRRYFRVAVEDRQAMLMFAPPPEEDPAPFIHVARWLRDNAMRAPEIYAQDAAQGWVLIEDFGDERMRDWLDANPQGETGAYTDAVDALARLHTKPAGPFAPYDMEVYAREAALLTEWYCPAMHIEADAGSYLSAWSETLAPLVAKPSSQVTVLRDYHAENIMLLGPDAAGRGAQGLIDFQDALVGHPAYDLVSLLQDARRDVSPDLERRMLDHYLAQADADDDFLANYARLGAQRNAKIVGIFARLWKRDGKPRYLSYIPRVWEALERDLRHPALAPVAAWFDTNIPRQVRDSFGGQIA